MLRLIVLALLAPLAAQAGCLRGEWYSVKPNGKLSTRPAYTLEKNDLIKSKVRAPVGATCDLTKPTKPSNKDLYASYYSTDLVALCSKRLAFTTFDNCPKALAKRTLNG